MGEVLAALETAHPGFKERLFDDDGQLRRFVNVFVADEDVRFAEGLDTAVGEGQTVSIIPARAPAADDPPRRLTAAGTLEPIGCRLPNPSEPWVFC